MPDELQPSEAELPVDDITQQEAQEYCNWLNDQPEARASGLYATLPRAEWLQAATWGQGLWPTPAVDAPGPYGHLRLIAHLWHWTCSHVDGSPSEVYSFGGSPAFAVDDDGALLYRGWRSLVRPQICHIPQLRTGFRIALAPKMPTEPNLS